MSKKIVLVSNGPVPTSQYKKIEGGGMRAFGLAQGLLAHGHDVTVAIRDTYPQLEKAENGIKLINWAPGRHLHEIIKSFDVVIISYSTGGIASAVADQISDDKLFILDCYVPIYIEVSARASEDKHTELKNYFRDITHFNRTLQRGDYFLYANNNQKHFYNGVLSSHGIINPVTYPQKRLLEVPFGISSEAGIVNKSVYEKIGVQKNDFIFLWFGGLYPWFDIKDLLVAIRDINELNKKVKLVIVGGKNPYNSNPDFLRQYEKAKEFSETNHLEKKVIFFVDWVDYEDRISWYRGADAIITLNSPGDENEYSWRTRLMDFIWGGAAVLTNGGDPLSEELIKNNAAIRVDSVNPLNFKDELIKLTGDNKARINSVRNNLTDLRVKYIWENVVLELSNIIASNEANPYRIFKESYSDILNSKNPGRKKSIVGRLFFKIREVGLKTTTKIVLRKMLNK